MIELHHWEPNGPALGVLVALGEKGLAFTSRYVDYLAFEQCAQPYAGQMEVEMNPDGEGPVLVDGGAAMTDGLFINLHLDETYSQSPLRSAGAVGHWRVLAWGRFVSDVLAPAVGTLGCHAYLAPSLRTRDRTAVERSIAAIGSHERRQAWLAALNDAYDDDLLADSRRKIGLAIGRTEQALAAGPWLLGETYGLTDIDVFGYLSAVPTLAPELLEGAPRTRDWLARMGERPAVKAALAFSRTGAPERAFTPGAEHSRWG